MSNFLADSSYLAVKPQSAAATPVIPTDFVPLIEESIRVNANYAADRRMKGLSWKSDELLKANRTIEGDLRVYCDPDNLGHLLNMAFAKGSTTGDATDGYTHPFTVGDGKHYSLEVSRGEFATRIFGARADRLRIEFEENKMASVVSIKALGQFQAASLAVALTGAGMTEVVLSTDYDLRPADGLVVGDVIRVGGVDVTLTSVNANGTTVGFASTSITASVGDTVYLLAQTPSFSALQEPFYMGNTLVGFGDDESAATTAAGARATAVPCYDLSTEFMQNLLDAPASGATGPSVLLNQTREGALELRRLFEDPEQMQKYLENKETAVTLIATGRHIKSDLTTSELLTIKYFRTKLVDLEEPLNVGEYIYDAETREVLYDSSEAKAVTFALVNRTAGGSY